MRRKVGSFMHMHMHMHMHMPIHMYMPMHMPMHMQKNNACTHDACPCTCTFFFADLRNIRRYYYLSKQLIQLQQAGTTAAKKKIAKYHIDGKARELRRLRGQLPSNFPLTVPPPRTQGYLWGVWNSLAVGPVVL